MNIPDILSVAKHVRIFPAEIVNGRKKPRITGWRVKATQDEVAIRAWWKRWPDALVGVATGPESQTFVIDVDVRADADGNDTMANLPALPPTTLVRTPSGGQHYYFRYPKGVRIPSVTDALGRRVDSRGVGGFAVVWPSPGYDLLEPFELMAEAPEWMVKQLSARPMVERSLNAGRMVKEDVIVRLGALDPAEYRSRSDWMRIIMAVKSASGGEPWGYEAALDWSRRDAEHFGHDVEPALAGIWNSVEIDKANGITSATLVAHSDHALAATTEVFDDLDVIERPRMRLQYHDRGPTVGRLKSLESNVMILLTEPRIRLRSGPEIENPLYNGLVYDELRETVVMFKRPVWSMRPASYSYVGGALLTDIDVSYFKAYLEQPPYYIVLTYSKVEAVMVAAAALNPNNPVRNYLDSLEWDGTPRLNTWLRTYCHTEKLPIIDVWGRKFMIGAVSRAYRPGCKMDTMLILEGDQGIRKSTLCKVLGGEFAGAPEMALEHKQDAEQNIAGLWLVEIDEMSGLSYHSKAGVERIKSFISKDVAQFRRSYASRAQAFPRRCVFIGTINPRGDGRYFADPTGNRRFWPVRVNGIIDTVGLSQVRDQLWAEASVAFRKGEIYHLTNDEEALARDEQQKRTISSTWFETVADYLSTGDGRGLKFVSATELLAYPLQISPGAQLHKHAMEIGDVLNRLGWVPKCTLVPGVKGGTRRWHRPAPIWGGLGLE